MANICIDKKGIPWDILSFKNDFEYKLLTDASCVCGYCLKPITFVKESISRTTREVLRSRHFRHLNPGDKDFCPYETGESLEHVTVKKDWFLNVLSANAEYLKIPSLSVQAEKTIKTDGRKATRRFDIGLYDGDNFFAALETEASIKTEQAFQIAERTLDYNCVGAAVDWAFTSDTDPAVAEVSLNRTGAYRRTNIFYKQEKQHNPSNNAFYLIEDRTVIERTSTLIYYLDCIEPVNVDVEQEAIRIEQLIRQACKIKANPDKYYLERKNLLSKLERADIPPQYARYHTIELPLSQLIKLMPEILSAPRQKIKVGNEFGLMTEIDIKGGTVTYIPFRSKQSLIIPIDEVKVCDPKINCLHIGSDKLTPEKVMEYRTAVTEAKQSINAMSNVEPTVNSSNCFDVVAQLAPEISTSLDSTEFDPMNLPGLSELKKQDSTTQQTSQEEATEPQLITNYTVGSRVRFLGEGKLNNLLATIIVCKPYSTSSVSKLIILRFDADLPAHLKEQPVTVPQNANWLGGNFDILSC